MRKENKERTRQNMVMLREQYHMNPNNQQITDRLIGQRLRFAREVKGLTQSKVGKICGFTFQQCQKYEQGDNSIKVRHLLKYSDGIGFSLKWFFKPFKYKEEDSRETTD